MMIFVGMINTITAILVLILERTKMIGVLKSLGVIIGVFSFYLHGWTPNYLWTFNWKCN